jgi:hypothetical protein
MPNNNRSATYGQTSAILQIQDGGIRRLENRKSPATSKVLDLFVCSFVSNCLRTAMYHSRRGSRVTSSKVQNGCSAVLKIKNRLYWRKKLSKNHEILSVNPKQE